MNEKTLLPVDRFLHTLEIVRREGRHLAYSWNALERYEIDAAWVERLDREPALAVELEAFVSRFGRMQDTIADKLLPRWLMALAERPGSQIDVLNRAERLGVVESTERWLEARRLRNQLVHEYMEDPAQFAEALGLALEFVALLMETYHRLRDYALRKMALDVDEAPGVIDWSKG